jgi:hypothetical protein
MPDITDFQIGQGETFKVKMQLLDKNSNNIPLDISDYNFFGQIRENYTTDELTAEFTFEKIIPYSSGSVFIQLSADQTNTFTQRKYVYDIKYISGTVSPMSRRLLEGAIIVRPAVTR